jgi:hypothetical protein
MKYAVEMLSGAMICVSVLIQAFKNCNKRDTQTYRQHGDLINLPLFQNNESRLKIA